jgi:CheY-like chemotaxis protein
MLPRIDGLKATQMLRAFSETSQIPILVTSALAGGSDVAACIDAGYSDYIAKPFAFDQLQTKSAN